MQKLSIPRQRPSRKAAFPMLEFSGVPPHWRQFMAAVLPPAKIAIFEALWESKKPLSPSDLRRRFEKTWSLGLISYHCIQLEKEGVLELVETVTVKGALKNLYVVAFDRPSSQAPRSEGV